MRAAWSGTNPAVRLSLFRFACLNGPDRSAVFGYAERPNTQKRSAGAARRSAIAVCLLHFLAERPSRSDDLSRSSQQQLAVCWSWSISRRAFTSPQERAEEIDNSTVYSELRARTRRSPTVGTARALEVIERSNLLNLTQTLF